MVHAIADRHDVERLRCRQHMDVTCSGVVCVAMGDQRPVDVAHRIDEEIPRWAVESFAARDQQVFGFHCHDHQVGRIGRIRKGLRFTGSQRIGCASVPFWSTHDILSAFLWRSHCRSPRSLCPPIRRGGDLGAAIDLQRQALELTPGWAAGWQALGNYIETSGDLSAAADAWRKVLVLSPTDIFGAGLKLSLTGQAEMPATPPSEYVEALFDGYSDRFDTALVENLGYCVPERLAALLADVSGVDAQFAKVIDLGCGTGLFGERIRCTTSWLEGYDLSQGCSPKPVRKGSTTTLDMPIFSTASRRHG